MNRNFDSRVLIGTRRNPCILTPFRKGVLDEIDPHYLYYRRHGEPYHTILYTKNLGSLTDRFAQVYKKSIFYRPENLSQAQHDLVYCKKPFNPLAQDMLLAKKYVYKWRMYTMYANLNNRPLSGRRDPQSETF